MNETKTQLIELYNEKKEKAKESFRKMEFKFPKGTMDNTLCEIPLPLVCQAKDVVSEELYIKLDVNKNLDGSIKNIVDGKVDIIDTFNYAKDDVNIKADLFEVSEGKRCFREWDKIFLVDGFYIYIKLKYTYKLYYIGGEDNPLDYIKGNFNYACGLALRDFNINNYHDNEKNPINCNRGMVYDCGDKEGISYNASILKDVINYDTGTSVMLFYVNDDDRIVKFNNKRLFGIYNGFYLGVLKNNFKELYFLGDNFEYALDMLEKSKKF